MNSCPTCKQVIELDFKTTQITELNSKTHKCSDGLITLESQILEQQAKLNDIQKISLQIQCRQVDIASNTMSIVESNKYIGKLQKEIKQLQKENQKLQKQLNTPPSDKPKKQTTTKKFVTPVPTQ